MLHKLPSSGIYLIFLTNQPPTLAAVSFRTDTKPPGCCFPLASFFSLGLVLSKSYNNNPPSSTIETALPYTGMKSAIADMNSIVPANHSPFLNLIYDSTKPAKPPIKGINFNTVNSFVPTLFAVFRRVGTNFNPYFTALTAALAAPVEPKLLSVKS